MDDWELALYKYCILLLLHIIFSSLKSLDSKKEAVASSTVSLVVEGTQTMCVDVEGEIPVDGECITLSYFI